MKKFLLLFVFSTVLSAANLRWTETFTDGWTDAGGSAGSGSVIGTLTAEVLDGASIAQITMTLESPYSNLLVAWWRSDWLQSPWDQHQFSSVGVAYDVPAGLIVEGQENLLKPFYWQGGSLNQVWTVAEWSAPVEWTVIEPPPIDPGDGGGGEGGGGGGGGGEGGGGEIPEPSTYTLISALGLLGFALRRRLCHA